MRGYGPGGKETGVKGQGYGTGEARSRGGTAGSSRGKAAEGSQGQTAEVMGLGEAGWRLRDATRLRG